MYGTFADIPALCSIGEEGESQVSQQYWQTKHVLFNLINLENPYQTGLKIYTVLAILLLVSPVTLISFDIRVRFDIGISGLTNMRIFKIPS